MVDIDFTGANTVKGWLDRVVVAAIDNGWSDIQIRLTRDPEYVALGQAATGSAVEIRARINRTMQPVATLKGQNADTLVNHIKATAGIGSGPAIQPLDGLYPFKETVEDGELARAVDIRVAVFPTYAGETLALRLPAADVAVTMDDLNLNAHNRQLVDRAIGMANGLVLVAGPVGSGKSTTLRTFVRALGGPDVTVWTVEDPVEMRIEDVDQISINAEAGNGWPEVLTGLRRSDLEVLMIGEIRNFEQASAALEIGNSGAKVLASIHANDSIGAVMQLMALADAKPRTLGAQLRAVISQRLLRRLCTDCAGAGCGTCGDSGYRGLCPIHEVLLLNDDFAAALAAGANLAELHAVAAGNGMFTLRHCAQELVESGVTDLREVRRVLGVD